VVGSVNGKVALTAGGTVHITGSDVLSDTATAIIGKDVIIDAAVNTTEATQTYKEKSAGIHLGLSGGVVTAAETAYGRGKAAGDVKDDRLKAVYAAQAVGAGIAAAEGAQALAKQGNQSADAGVSLRIGIGASSASAQTDVSSETAQGGRIQSNGAISIMATDGDLSVIGSQIEGNTVGLAATGDINLTSQAEQHRSESRNKNGSAEIGFSIGSTTGFYVTANAGKGKGAGNGTTHAETTIRGREGVAFVSGGDTTLEGAQVVADQITGKVGGDFNVISQQDTDDYASKQQQAGGTFVYGYGGSAYYGQQKADSQYTSVQEQSGIQAGQGGFQIDVEGNTHLKGGALASNADPSRNQLSTGSLTVEDIENDAHYKATNFGAGTDGTNWQQAAVGAGLSALGNQKDSASSTTRSDIAAGTVDVRNGDTSAVAGLDRTTTVLDGNGLNPIYDQQKIDEAFALGQEAAKIGFQMAGGLAEIKQQQAMQDLANATTEEEKQAAQARIDSWSDGGTSKVVLHGMTGAAVAALGGGDALQGGLGAAGAEKAKEAMSNYLDAKGIKVGSAEYDSLMELGSAALGGLLGGVTGAGTALAGDQFNRQLHQDELAFLAAKADDYAEERDITRQEAEQELLRAMLWTLDAESYDKLGGEGAGGKYQDAANWLAAEAAAVGLRFINEDGQSQQAFTVDSLQQYADNDLFGNPYKGNILTRGIDWAFDTDLTNSRKISQQDYQDALNAVRFEGEYKEWRASKPADVKDWTEADWNEHKKWAAEDFARGLAGFGFAGGIGQIAVNAADGNFGQIRDDAVASAVLGGLPIRRIEGLAETVDDLAKSKADNIAATTFFRQERQFWSKEPVEVAGGKVYQRDDLIDPAFVDPRTGKTNLELMQAGRAPIGPDGRPINLHHMLQTQDGPIAEVTQTFHKVNSSAIHINSGSKIPSGINRSKFDAWREAYWKQRANDFPGN